MALASRPAQEAAAAAVSDPSGDAPGMYQVIWHTALALPAAHAAGAAAARPVVALEGRVVWLRPGGGDWTADRAATRALDIVQSGGWAPS